MRWGAATSATEGQDYSGVAVEDQLLVLCHRHGHGPICLSPTTSLGARPQAGLVSRRYLLQPCSHHFVVCPHHFRRSGTVGDAVGLRFQVIIYSLQSNSCGAVSMLASWTSHPPRLITSMRLQIRSSSRAMHCVLPAPISLLNSACWSSVLALQHHPTTGASNQRAAISSVACSLQPPATPAPSHRCSKITRRPTLAASWQLKSE